MTGDGVHLNERCAVGVSQRERGGAVVEDVDPVRHRQGFGGQCREHGFDIRARSEVVLHDQRVDTVAHQNVGLLHRAVQNIARILALEVQHGQDRLRYPEKTRHFSHSSGSAMAVVKLNWMREE